MMLTKGDRVRFNRDARITHTDTLVLTGATGEVVKLTAKKVWVYLDTDRDRLDEKGTTIIDESDKKAYIAKHSQPGVLGVPFYQTKQAWAVGVAPHLLEKE